MRSTIAAASAAVLLAASVYRCGAVQPEIEEVDAVKRQALTAVLVHAYSDKTAPRGHVLKFIIAAQINGVRTHNEFLIKPDKLGDTTCDYSVGILSVHHVEISAYTSIGNLRKRFQNVFYDRKGPSVAFYCWVGLRTIVGPAEGKPVYLLAGPFPKGKTLSERKRLLKHYEKTNYILLRLT